MTARSRRTIVITGASRGIGRAAAARLIRDGQRVILAVRDTIAVASLRDEAAEPDLVSIEQVDLASLRSVRTLAERLPTIDVLICNAGVQVPAGTRLTEDGFELTFGVNHLAHFALASWTIDRVRVGGRLVFLSSTTHDAGHRTNRVFGFRGPRFAPVDDMAAGLHEPGLSDRQVGMDRYATSKFCTVLTAHAFASRHDPARLGVFCFDPGLVPATGLARSHPLLTRMLYAAAAPLLELLPGSSTPRKSGDALAWVAMTDALRGHTGAQLDNRRQDVSAAADAHRRDFQESLYQGSRRLIERVLADAAGSRGTFSQAGADGSSSASHAVPVAHARTNDSSCTV